MYRYRFNPYSCRWEIQLLWRGLIWRTLRTVSFDTIAGAILYVNQAGLGEHYKEQRPFNHTPITQEQADVQS